MKTENSHSDPERHLYSTNTPAPSTPTPRRSAPRSFAYATASSFTPHHSSGWIEKALSPPITYNNEGRTAFDVPRRNSGDGDAATNISNSSRRGGDVRIRSVHPLSYLFWSLTDSFASAAAAAVVVAPAAVSAISHQHLCLCSCPCQQTNYIVYSYA